MMTEKPVIRCKWAEKNRFVVNPDGQVWPCCYFANFTYLGSQYKQQGREEELFEGHKRQLKDPLIAEYFADADRYNAFKRPVHEILNDKWFNESLPNSWESEDTLQYQCRRMCKIEPDEQ